MLVAEADFVAHDWTARTAFFEVVGEELSLLGVTAEHAFGKDAPPCPERHCEACLPSIELLGTLLST